MALYVNNNQVTTIYKGRKTISAVYQGAKLIWQYIKSCYGRGYWLNNKSWSDKDGWAN